MTEKKFITFLLISLFLIGALIYFGEKETFDPESQRIEFSYTFANREEVRDFIEHDISSFKWLSVPFGTTKLNYSDEKYTILKIKLHNKMNSEKALYFRFKNKIYEVYIDGVLIKRNGVVGEYYNQVTTYSEFKIPLDKKYEGKDVIVVLESPTKFEIVNIETAEVISTADFFNSYSLFDVITTFFMIIAMVISGLAALNVYWMRFNFGGQVYKAIFPLWLILGSLILDTPYVHFNYFVGTQVCVILSVICAITGLFIICYSARRKTQYRYASAAISVLITFMWIFTVNMIILLVMGKVNWSFVQYLMGKLVLGLSIPIFIYCYIHSKHLDEVFVIPLKAFFVALILVFVVCYGLYCIQPYFTSVIAMNYVTIYVVLALIILSSYIINTFHTNLFVELRNIYVENDMYNHIELSRATAKESENLEEEDQYNNFSIDYVESVLQSEMNATSIIIKEEQNEEIEVIYVRSNFGKIVLTNEEAKYYLSIYNSVFKNNNKNSVQIGKTLYLGFKQSNLYYFMIIYSNEVVSKLKMKALNTYATGIKNTAHNYVITRYVEQARNDVIKSFGETIESRISSNNIIGITDKFVVFIARSLGKSEREVQTLKTASYIKNIGSIIMSERELNDYGSMTQEELENVYKCSDYGYEILKKFEDTILSKAAKMAYFQFESYDGSGHLGIEGEEIPDEGKIIKMAVCMTSALRNNINMDNLFVEIMDFVESKYSNVLSPYLISKCKENAGAFDEIVLRDREQFYELAKEASMLELDNFIN